MCRPVCLVPHVVPDARPSCRSGCRAGSPLPSRTGGRRVRPLQPVRDECPYTRTDGARCRRSSPDVAGRAMQHDADITSCVRGRPHRSSPGPTSSGRWRRRHRRSSPGSSGRDPPFAKQRFSRWFKTDRDHRRGHRQHQVGPVTLFPTCLVEYRETDIGTSAVAEYEARGIDCSLSQAGCCGAPWLHAGDVKRFTKVATTKRRAARGRGATGNRCGGPRTDLSRRDRPRDYLDYVDGPDAALVAAHTFDADGYLHAAGIGVRTLNGSKRRFSRASGVFPGFLWLSVQGRSTFVFSIGPVRRTDGTTAARPGESVNCVSAGNEVVGSRGVSGARRVDVLPRRRRGRRSRQIGVRGLLRPRRPVSSMLCRCVRRPACGVERPSVIVVD